MTNHFELKPCPFCGSEAEFKHDSGSYGYTPPSVKVTCSKAYDKWYRAEHMKHAIIDKKATCFAETPSKNTVAHETGVGHYTVEHEAKLEVADMWNTRAVT